uniref:Transient receptor potential cation channel, subfamily M, member 4a n=1 Tax=Mastacembelus armatus TaxID=205130 RepID=A0A7N9AYM4_9TELE
MDDASLTSLLACVLCVSNGTLCQCGGGQEMHESVATVDYFGSSIITQWDSRQHTSEYPTDAFGELEFAGQGRKRSHFLRLSYDTSPQSVYRLMTLNWGLPSPNLVVSVVGGEGHGIKTWVRDVLRNGLVKAAQSTGAWILTGGLREGVSRCVGEAVRDHGAAAPVLSHSKVIAVGLTPWGQVHNKQQLVNVQGSFPARYYVQNPSQDSPCLDNNYQAFLLVDDGSVDCRQGLAAFCGNLEDYISHQRTGIRGSGNIEIPVLCMLISGDACMLERIDTSLKKNIPWLILAGSGSAADLLSDTLENFCSISLPSPGPQLEVAQGLSTEHRNWVRDKVKKHFPAEVELEKLVDRVLSIYHNRVLITVFNREQEGCDDFDTVLLKALVRASKHVSREASEYTEELKLAVAWNRVDIAKTELFNGNIHWKYEDLEDSMTDALINNKSQFVRLFCKNGLNILDYLTYRRLESLYRSLSDSSLAYILLQRCLRERQGLPVGSLPMKCVLMLQVSHLLSDLLGDVCQPFYHKPLGLKHSNSSRKTLKVSMLSGECTYRNKACDSPWVALFIWSILQNRKEMAVYFWEMAGESVLSALGGCKILRELSKLESETETKLAMKELARTFENLAHDVFGECYQNSESRAFKLLIAKSPVWGGATCLQMASVADARRFFSHDGVQSLLSQIWWGDMKRNTKAWKLVLTFFLPPLIYTDLISFRSLLMHLNDSYSYYVLLLFASDSLPSKTKRPSIVSRWRKFWFAPVTAFLGNVMMYFLFLCLYAYVLLVNFKPPPPDGPATLEYVLYFWVFTLVCEEIRQSFFVGSTFVQRIKNYIQDDWNKCDFTAISLFTLGLCCRMFPWSFDFGRQVMAIDFLVFTLRLIHIFAVHKQLGPKIIIVGKMVKDVFFFLFFLAVWLVAYGVANQTLLYTYDPRPLWIFRRVFYRPYMQIFGQIAMHEIDGKNCTDNITRIEAGEEPCVNTNANWLVIILLVIYLLFTNIVLSNGVRYTFSKVQGHSDIYWKFQRYNLIVEYHSRPSLAPPFIIISHLHLFIKRCIRRIPSVKSKHFVLELPAKKASGLNAWEAIQKETLLSAQNKYQRDTDTARLKHLEYCCKALSWMTDALSQSDLIKADCPPPNR